MEQLQQKIEVYLDGIYNKTHRLHDAMRYSLLAGGKRFRPLLVLHAAQDFKISHEVIIPAAAAIEMIHTYSLIHDDLPALDNDDLRRGKPTNHRVYGESTAILAGDALLTDAFSELLKVATTSDIKVQMIDYLSKSTGSFGMVKGQSDDLHFEHKRNELDENQAYDILKNIHANKTGKLIETCLVLPALVAHVNEKKMAWIKEVSQYIGLWFQIRDDILDVVATTDELGKDAGSDIENDKLTYVSLFNLEGAKQKLLACEQDIHRIFSTELSDMEGTYGYISSVMR